MGFLIDALFSIEYIKITVEAEMLYRFFLPKAQDAFSGEAAMEQFQYPLFESLVEIDKHVSANDELSISEYTVTRQVVACECDVALKSIVDLCAAIFAVKVVA